MEVLVNFSSGPVDVLSILSHFKTRSCYTTSVHSLTRSVNHLCIEEYVDSFSSTAHVRNFSYEKHLVVAEHFSVSLVDFVLSCARHSDVNFLFPRFLASEELSVREFFYVWSTNVVARSTKFEHSLNLFRSVDTIWVVDVTVRTRDSHNLCTEFGSLGYCTPSHVAEARDSHSLTIEVSAEVLQHALYEVASAETCSFWTDTAAAKFEALTSKSTGAFASELLVHAIEVTNFTTTYADVASRNVGVRTDVAPQFNHESLAETHDFSIALAAWAEVGTTLATTHRKCGKSIFECLFEAEELQD